MRPLPVRHGRRNILRKLIFDIPASTSRTAELGSLGSWAVRSAVVVRQLRGRKRVIEINTGKTNTCTLSQGGERRSADVWEKCAIIQEPELQYVGIFTFFVKRLSERNFSQYFTKPVVNLLRNLSQVSSRVKFEADTGHIITHKVRKRMHTLSL